MKAITLWQPWATLVMLGYKTYETRQWSTQYRGPLAIHAAKREPVHVQSLMLSQRKRQRERSQVFRECLAKHGLAYSTLPRGAVLGIVQLDDVVPVEQIRYVVNAFNRVFGDWSDGRFAWRLSNIQTFRNPVLAQGKQGLWDWSGSEYNYSH